MLEAVQETAALEAIAFTVVGHPMPGGSKKAFVNPRTDRVVVVDDAKNKPWRRLVANAAADATPMGGMLLGAVRAEFRFFRARPKSHYRTGRYAAMLKGSAPAFPISAPDVLKLARAAEDACTGIVYRDDAQIVDERLSKAWGLPERVEVLVVPLEGM